MTWLILGGSGQLGVSLSNELENRGIVFKAPGRKELDITNSLNVRKVISALVPSVIINCAAWTDVDEAEVNEEMVFLVNSKSVENIAFAAKDCGAKFIQISTDYVFSGRSDKPWKETDVKQPLSIYGRSKASGEEKAIEVYSEGSFIIRTAWLYSPWGKNFAKTMTRLAIKSDCEVRVVNDQVGQPTSAIDLSKQLVDLGLSSSNAGTYHGTNSGQATWFEFAQKIFKLAGAEVDRVKAISSGEFIRPAKRPSYSVLGHEAWKITSVKPMRDWKIALTEAMPAIILAVKAEE